MKMKTFYLFNAINCEGLDYSQWGINLLLHEVSTREFYGTDEDIMLESGVWVSVFENEDNPYMFKEAYAVPNHILHYHNGCNLLLYNVTD